MVKLASTPHNHGDSACEIGLVGGKLTRHVELNGGTGKVWAKALASLARIAWGEEAGKI